MQPVVAALGQLFAGVAAAQGGQPAKKRELDDSSKRLGVLFWCAHLGSRTLTHVCIAICTTDSKPEQAVLVRPNLVLPQVLFHRLSWLTTPCRCCAVQYVREIPNDVPL